MTFINWADSDEMLGLLVEYVADERADSHRDRERMTFLDELSFELAELAGFAAETSPGETIERLRAIHDSRTADFAEDPVMAHVAACIEELERIALEPRSADLPH